MRVCVTGSEGYIGSVLLPRLRSEGHEVVGLDTGYFSDCYIDPETELTPYRRVDVRDVVPDNFSGFDAVIHLAGLSNDPLGDLNQRLTNDINVVGTERVASAAKRAGVSRFVFASSCSVYGAGDGDSELLESSPVAPLTAYARSKVAGEDFLSGLADAAFSCVSLRAATVFGASPRTRLDLVLNELTAQAVAGLPVRLSSSGTAWRPFLYIDDLCDAYLAVLAADPSDRPATAFNVGSERATFQVIRAAEVIAELTGSELVVHPDAPTDIRNYRVNFNAFSEAYGTWNASHSVDEGILALVRHFEACRITPATVTSPRLRRLPHLEYLQRAGVLGVDMRMVD